MTARQRDLARRELIGLAPQHPRLFPELTGVQNVDLARSGAATSRSRALFSRVGLGERTDQPVNTLSGGERNGCRWPGPSSTPPASSSPTSPRPGSTTATPTWWASCWPRSPRGGGVVIASHDARVLCVATRTMSLSRAIPA